MVSDEARGSALSRQLYYGFVGELGDMTFFVTLMLAAWCPVSGVRRAAPGVGFQQALVALGSVAALTLRLCMNSAGFLSNWHVYFAYTTGALIFGMGLKAHLDLAKLDANVKAPIRKPLDSTQNTAWATPSPFWHQTEDEEVNRADDADAPGLSAGYGATPSSSSVPGVRSASESSAECSEVMLACILPCILVFVAEANDKSAALAGADVQHNPILVPARALGAALAASLAVLLGFVMERQADDRRILSAISFACFGLALLSVSEALQPVSRAAASAASQAALQVRSFSSSLLRLLQTKSAQL